MRGGGAIVAAGVLMMLADGAPAGPALSRPAAIRVDCARVEGRVGEYVFGHFVEFMYTCVNGGLWAEALRDGGFENADENGDGVSDPWQPTGGAVCAIDGERAYPAPGELSRSQRVEARGAHEVGIRQAPIAARTGEATMFRAYLQGEGVKQVRLSLLSRRGEELARAAVEGIGSGWRKFSARLRPTASDDEAALEIAFQAPGRVWIDRASLMPESAVEGYRADVLAAVRALRPSVIRFPGGNFAQCYHWTDGIGPRDQRPTTINYAWSKWLEPNDVGIDEFMTLCRLVGAEPLICVNIGDTGSRNRVPHNDTTRALRDAVRWLEYCNGDADTPYGRLRARNGHPEPYRVRLWEVGNEIYGDWEIGHVDAAAYARKLARFARALRRQGQEIEILACGADERWNRTVLQMAGSEIDWLVLHLYYKSDSYADLVAQPRNYGRFLEETRRLIEEVAPGRKIRISLNEWNCPLGMPAIHSLKAGLFGACLLHQVMRRDFVAMANCSDLVNGWPGGLIQADHAGLFVTPTYRVMQMLANHHGPLRVAVAVKCATFDAPTQGRGHPTLDVVAMMNEERTRLFLSVINRDAEHAAAAQVGLSGCRVDEGEAQVHVVSAPSVDSFNSRDHPDAVSLTSGALAVPATDFRHTFPPASASVLVIPIARR